MEKTVDARKKFYKAARPHWGTMITGLLLLLIATILDTAVIPVMLVALLFVIVGSDMIAEKGLSLPFVQDNINQFMTDVLKNQGGMMVLIYVSVAICAVVLVKCIFQAQQGYLMNKFGYLVSKDLRDRLFKHTLSLSSEQYEKESTGGLLSRITADVSLIQQTFGMQFSDIAQGPPSIIIALAIMLSVSWQLTLAVLCLTPIITGLIVVASRKMKKLIILAQERLEGLNSHLAELLANLPVIQSFTQEDYEARRVGDANQRYYTDSMRSVWIMELLGPTSEFMGMVGLLIGVGIGGWFVLNTAADQPMTPQNFLLFILVAQRASSQSKRMALMSRMVQQIDGACERIFSLLDTEPAIKDTPDSKPLDTIKGKVAFENVSFQYVKDSDVLSDISFEVSPGDILALVGPSGSGKTTLTKMLLRFYDPSGGRILVDDCDLRDVTIHSLRSQIGIVPQETVLFSGNIRENIRYGKLDATDREVEEAARAANAYDFIIESKDGFDTPVGERGMSLSGGQRQRIAIARVLLKNPRILILDEATSALDSESERLVQEAMERLMQGRTTFIIAHRLSTVRHATRILTLDKGRIAEFGTHKELMAKRGLYRHLYEMQFNLTEDGVPAESRE